MPAKKFNSLQEIKEYIASHEKQEIAFFCNVYFAENQEQANKLQVKEPGYYLYRSDFAKYLPQYMCVIRDMDGLNCQEGNIIDLNGCSKTNDS